MGQHDGDPLVEPPDGPERERVERHDAARLVQQRVALEHRWRTAGGEGGRSHSARLEAGGAAPGQSRGRTPSPAPATWAAVRASLQSMKTPSFSRSASSTSSSSVGMRAAGNAVPSVALPPETNFAAALSLRRPSAENPRTAARGRVRGWAGAAGGVGTWEEARRWGHREGRGGVRRRSGSGEAPAHPSRGRLSSCPPWHRG